MGASPILKSPCDLAARVPVQLSSALSPEYPNTMPPSNSGLRHGSHHPSIGGTVTCSRRCAFFFAVLTSQWTATGFSPKPAFSVPGYSRIAYFHAGFKRQRAGPLEGLRLKRGRDGDRSGGSSGGPEDPFAYSQMESLKWQLRDAEIRAAAAIRERDATATRTGNSSLLFAYISLLYCS